MLIAPRLPLLHSKMQRKANEKQCLEAEGKFKSGNKRHIFKSEGLLTVGTIYPEVRKKLKR